MAECDAAAASAPILSKPSVLCASLLRQHEIRSRHERFGRLAQHGALGQSIRELRTRLGGAVFSPRLAGPAVVPLWLVAAASA